MTKVQKIVVSTFLILAAVLFVVLAAWNPCAYALIVPSVLAFIGFTTWIVAKVDAKRNNKAKFALNA